MLTPYIEFESVCQLDSKDGVKKVLGGEKPASGSAK